MGVPCGVGVLVRNDRGGVVGWRVGAEPGVFVAISPADWVLVAVGSFVAVEVGSCVAVGEGSLVAVRVEVGDGVAIGGAVGASVGVSVATGVEVGCTGVGVGRPVVSQPHSALRSKGRRRSGKSVRRIVE